MQVMAGILKMDAALELLGQLSLIRDHLTMPMDIHIRVWNSTKNRSISTLEYGDDEVFALFRADRAQLQELFESLRAPALLIYNSYRTRQAGSVFIMRLT
jgi:hypothetical protein